MSHFNFGELAQKANMHGAKSVAKAMRANMARYRYEFQAAQLIPTWPGDSIAVVYERGANYIPDEELDRWGVFELSDGEFAGDTSDRCLVESNYAFVTKELKRFGRSVRYYHGIRGATVVAVKLRRVDGNETAVLDALTDLLADYDNYPCLDEVDYSQREYEAAVEHIQGEIERHEEFEGDSEAAAGYAPSVLRILEGDNKSSGEIADGRYDDDELTAALRKVGAKYARQCTCRGACSSAP